MTKTCTKCKEEKPVSEFHKRRDTKGGFKSWCKVCRRPASIKNNKDRYWRMRDEYLRKNKEYAQTERGRRSRRERAARSRINNEKQCKARRALFGEIRAGRMDRLPCEVCGTEENIHGHHTDYNKPLDVMWLCRAHHQEWHRNNTPVY